MTEQARKRYRLTGTFRSEDEIRAWIADPSTEYKPAMSEAEIQAAAALMLQSQERHGEPSFSDPTEMIDEAIGRFQPIEKLSTLKRAQTLCKQEQYGGGQHDRFRCRTNDSMDIVIALSDKRKRDGSEHYIVFIRSYVGRKNGVCYTCLNAAKRGMTPKAHDCWKLKQWDDWMPVSYFSAVNYDQAEEVAKLVLNAWDADSEYEQQGWDHEIPFSGDMLSQFVALRPNAWNSNSYDGDTGEE